MRQDDGSELFKLRFIRERYGSSIRASAARHNIILSHPPVGIILTRSSILKKRPQKNFAGRRTLTPSACVGVGQCRSVSKDGYLLACSQRARSSHEVKSSRASPSSSIFDNGSFRTHFC